MLYRRRRRWAHIKPTLDQRLVFAGSHTTNSELLLAQYQRQWVSIVTAQLLHLT